MTFHCFTFLHLDIITDVATDSLSDIQIILKWKTLEIFYG